MTRRSCRCTGTGLGKFVAKDYGKVELKLELYKVDLDLFLYIVRLDVK